MVCLHTVLHVGLSVELEQGKGIKQKQLKWEALITVELIKDKFPRV